jgi:hypothetical protein
VERPASAIAYDRAAQVNMPAGQAIPAARGGLDVTSVGVHAED